MSARHPICARKLEKRPGLFPDLFDEVAGWNRLGHSSRLAGPYLHSVVVACSGASLLQYGGQASLYRVRRRGRRIGGCGRCYEVRRDGATEASGERPSKSSAFGFEVRKCFGPCWMRLRFGTTQKNRT